MENSKAYLYLIEQLDVNLKNGDDEIDIRAFEDLLPNEVGLVLCQDLVQIKMRGSAS